MIFAQEPSQLSTATNTSFQTRSAKHPDSSSSWTRGTGKKEPLIYTIIQKSLRRSCSNSYTSLSRIYI